MDRVAADYSEFAADPDEIAVLPAGLGEDGDLYVLPDGRYLPCGVYQCADGCDFIYEPRELSFFGRLLIDLHGGR